MNLHKASVWTLCGALIVAALSLSLACGGDTSSPPAGENGALTTTPAPTVSDDAGGTAEPTSSDAAGTSEPSDTARAEPTPKPAGPVRVGTTLQADDVAVTLASYDASYSEPHQFIAPAQGFRLVAAEVVIIKNSTEASQPGAQLDFEVRDSEGTRYKPRGATIDLGTSDGVVESGDEVRALIFFEVTEGAAGLELIYAPDTDLDRSWRLE